MKGTMVEQVITELKKMMRFVSVMDNERYVHFLDAIVERYNE